MLVNDLGGLVVEMARRGVHNHALVERRAADVVELERHIAELDGRLLAASEVRRGHVAVPPLMAQIEAAGRPAATPCATCHALLANDANFCAVLRRPAGAPVTDDEAFEEGCSADALPDLPRRRRARPAVLPGVRRAARSRRPAAVEPAARPHARRPRP